MNKKNNDNNNNGKNIDNQQQKEFQENVLKLLLEDKEQTLYLNTNIIFGNNTITNDCFPNEKLHNILLSVLGEDYKNIAQFFLSQEFQLMFNFREQLTLLLQQKFPNLKMADLPDYVQEIK